MKKILILILIIFFIFIAIFIFILGQENTARVTIKNNSNQVISELNVSLYRDNKKYTIKNMKIGAYKNITFKILSDTHYILNGKLFNGTNINENIGYLTNGVDYDETILIKENGKVELKKQN